MTVAIVNPIPPCAICGAPAAGLGVFDRCGEVVRLPVCDRCWALGDQFFTDQLNAAAYLRAALEAPIRPESVCQFCGGRPDRWRPFEMLDGNIAVLATCDRCWSRPPKWQRERVAGFLREGRLLPAPMVERPAVGEG